MQITARKRGGGGGWPVEKKEKKERLKRAKVSDEIASTLETCSLKRSGLADARDSTASENGFILGGWRRWRPSFCGGERGRVAAGRGRDDGKGLNCPRVN